jgi:predicted permease
MVTSVAVLSLALGIGANVAIFIVFDALLLRSLPVRDPGEIVTISTFAKTASSRAGFGDNVSFPMYEQFRLHSSVGIIGIGGEIDTLRVMAHGSADFARAEAVSGNYHSVLGVAPAVGRLLAETDDSGSAAPVCVLGYRYWQTHFAGDRVIVGQRIVVGEASLTVVGVEPKEFVGLISGYAPDLRFPIHLMTQVLPRLANRGLFFDPDQSWVELAARVPTNGQARLGAELNALYHQSPSEQQNREVVLGPGVWDGIGGNFRQPLIVLMAAVGLLLLIACANLANLLLARAQTRERETAIRLALGAARGRLARQLLTESLSLAAAGAALGIVLGYWASSVLASFNSLAIDLRPDARVLAFTAALTSLTGVLFGLAPALRTARANLHPSLQSGLGASRFGLANLLIVAQFSLSMVALVGAGLYMRTLHNLRGVDLGIDIHRLSMFRLYPRSSGYHTKEDATEFAQRVLDGLAKTPGVELAALSRSIPLAGPWTDTTIEVPGITRDARMAKVSMNQVTSRFFQAMGIPVLLGRGIVDGDSACAIPPAVVNETLARSYLSARSPIGAHFREKNRDYEIVGVVRDANIGGGRNALRGTVPPTFFVSDPQSAAFDGFAVEVRTRKGVAPLSVDIRRAIAGIDPGVPLRDLETAGQTIDRLTRRERLLAGLSSVIGGFALLLAAIGLYGVRAYAVARRAQEIGIRVALGANRGTIAKMILSETGWLALFGISIGLAVALAVTRYVQSMLYGVPANDYVTIAAAAALLIAVATIAGYLPAHRAARIDPLVALRHD